MLGLMFFSTTGFPDESGIYRTIREERTDEDHEKHQSGYPPAG